MPLKIADDLLQPIWGVVHLLTAVAYVVALSFHVLHNIYLLIKFNFLGETLKKMFPSGKTEKSPAPPSFLSGLERTLVWLIYAIQNVLCGAIELVTTPLTYFYRIPLRLLLTFAGEKNQSTGLTVGSALLATGGMTFALWKGFAHFFPTLSVMAQQAVNHLGAQAMPIIQQSLLGMVAAGAVIALMSLAVTGCKKEPEGQGGPLANGAG